MKRSNKKRMNRRKRKLSADELSLDKSKKMKRITRPVICSGLIKQWRWRRSKSWMTSSLTRSLRLWTGRKYRKNCVTESWTQTSIAARRTMQRIITFQSKRSGERGRKATLVKFSDRPSTSVKRRSPITTQSFAGHSTRLATVPGATLASTSMTARIMQPVRSKK